MLPFPLFYLREFVVVQVVVRIHLDHLGLCGGSHHLYDLDQVVNAALSDEERNSMQHLKDHTAQRPDIDHS